MYQQEQQQEEIPPFPKLNYEYFDDEQRKYLEMLSKYSGRKSKLQIINQESIPLQKETYIKEHFVYLDINEQVNYNDHKMFLEKHKNYSYYIGAFTGLSLMGYYTIITPTARGLAKEAFKSLFFGGVCSYSYFKVREYQYKESLHNYYIMVLNRVNQRRREFIKKGLI